MTGEQARALQNALLNAFPSEEALRELLLFKLDLKLPEITEARSLRVKVLDVIQELDSCGRVDELVTRACELKPANFVLKDVVATHWPALAKSLGLPERTDRPVPQTTLDDDDWNDLIDAIREKKCTPVIGPDLCSGVLPENGQIADEWAEHYQYPFADRSDLTRVAQYLALTRHLLWPHKELHRRYTVPAIRDPDFASVEEPHAVLADLDLPLYLTVNYDDLMEKALASRHIAATRGFPRWRDQLREPPGLEARPGGNAGTLVYHLFGHHDVPASMALIEDDFLKLVAAVATEPGLFPTSVKTALVEHTLLVVGQRMLSYGFRVLVHTLLHSLAVKNQNFGIVVVQLPPEVVHKDQREQVEIYLKNFLENANFRVRICWDTAVQFMRELRTRWEERGRHAAAS